MDFFLNTVFSPFLPSEATFHLPGNLPVEFTTYLSGTHVKSMLLFGSTEESDNFIFDLAPHFTAAASIPWLLRSNLPETIPSDITGVCCSRIIWDPENPDKVRVGVRFKDDKQKVLGQILIPLDINDFKAFWKEVWSLPEKKKTLGKGPFGLW